MDGFHTEEEPKQYHFTNDIEGIEGGQIEILDDPWHYVKTFSIIEKIIKMSMQCAEARPKTFECARFTYRSIMEIVVVFLFISYFFIIWLL